MGLTGLMGLIGQSYKSHGPISPMNHMMSDIEEIRKLERAERAYDERRAALKQSSDLRVPPRIFQRYQSPPADTAFAIEYSYNLLGDVKGKDVLELGCGDGGLQPMSRQKISTPFRQRRQVVLRPRRRGAALLPPGPRATQTSRLAAEVRDGQSNQSREVMNYVDQS